MDKAIDKLCKRFLGINLTGSVYDRRRTCIQLIRTITELYNIEAYKRLEPSLSIGDLSSVNRINIDMVYKTILELYNNYIKLCSKRIPKIARNVVFKEGSFFNTPFSTWSDGKYEYIITFDSFGYRVTDAMARPEFINMRTDKDQKTITLLKDDAPYEYLVTVSGEVIIVNSLSYCFMCYEGSPLHTTSLADEEYTFIMNTNWDVSNVEYMTLMFGCCASLKDISALANWDVSNVTDMRLMFDSCTSLTTINGLNNRNISNVTNMSNMFDSCTSLTTINGLNNWNVSDVSDIFDGCTSLTTINGLNNWNVSDVSDMNYIFYEYTSLTTINGMNDWNVSNVGNMYDMFCECTSLTTINGMNDWNVSNVGNMYDMFCECTSLTTINGLNNWNVSNVSDMTSMFYDCTSLTTINGMNNWNVSNVTNMSYDPDAEDYSMFFGCTSLTTISGMNNWIISNVTDMSNMFAGCSSDLTGESAENVSITGLKNWIINNIETIGRMFYSYKYLPITSIKTALKSWRGIDTIKDVSEIFGGTIDNIDDSIKNINTVEALLNWINSTEE